MSYLPLTYSQKKKLPRVKTLDTAIKIIAALGGHQGRPSDPPPGFEAMGNGFKRLRDFVFILELVKNE
jgi:hypothetical protein